MSDQTLITVLENMARELDRLANVAGSIDSAMGHVTLSTDINGETLSALQSVDLLRQSLECLTHYVGGLASQVNETVRVNPVNAAKALPLRDLARDLVGSEEPDGHRRHGGSHNTCFF